MRPSWGSVFAVVVITAALGFLQAWRRLDGFEWLVMPPLCFAAIMVLMWISGKPVTRQWVAVSAAVSVAIGVFLRLT